jgi:uncharacterized protein (DUF58 family)
MEVSELIKKVRKLELKTKKQSSELFSGNYASTFKGRGMSFREVRAYNYGDDIRSIDWNVTSRMGDAHIKEFEEERELTFMLLVDVSNSTLYGSQSTLKKDIITEIAATIAFSALKNNDKVGVIFFSEKVERYIPPKKGKLHILTIIRELIETRASHSGTDISEALRFLQNTVKKKSVVFLLSDFLESNEFDKEVSIASLRHQFYAIQVYDRSEYEPPNIGIVKFTNSETGISEWVDTANTSFKGELQNRFETNMKETKVKFERLGDSYCDINIQEPYLARLASLFRKKN